MMKESIGVHVALVLSNLNKSFALGLPTISDSKEVDTATNKGVLLTGQEFKRVLFDQ